MINFFKNKDKSLHHNKSQGCYKVRRFYITQPFTKILKVVFNDR